MIDLNAKRLAAVTTYLYLLGSTLSLVPSTSPTLIPSSIPSISSWPSYQPTYSPSDQISDAPSFIPSEWTSNPSARPTNTLIPSSAPSEKLTQSPSRSTNIPSSSPTVSVHPSNQPSFFSSAPSFSPSLRPSEAKTLVPSAATNIPSIFSTVEITKKSNSQVKIIVITVSLAVGTIFLFTIWFVCIRGKCRRIVEEEEGNIEFIIEPSVSFNDDHDYVSEEVYDKSETDDNDEGLSYAGFSLATEDTHNRPVGFASQGRDMIPKKEDDLVRTWIGTGKLSNTEFFE